MLPGRSGTVTQVCLNAIDQALSGSAEYPRMRPESPTTSSDSSAPSRGSLSDAACQLPLPRPSGRLRSLVRYLPARRREL
jgi:hypothetical protein